MACQRCDHRGYIETLTARNGKYYPLILQCNYCRDMEAYMTRVKYMLEMQELVHKAKNAKPEKPESNMRRGEVAPVIPIRRKDAKPK